MNTVRIALVQLGYTDEEPVTDRVQRAADLVRGLAGHDLVVLPELWAPTGFGYRNWDERAEPTEWTGAAQTVDPTRDAPAALGQLRQLLGPGGPLPEAGEAHPGPQIGFIMHGQQSLQGYFRCLDHSGRRHRGHRLRRRIRRARPAPGGQRQQRQSQYGRHAQPQFAAPP